MWYILLMLFLMTLLCLYCIALLGMVAKGAIKELSAENEVLAEENRRRKEQDAFLDWDRHRRMLEEDTRRFREARQEWSVNEVGV